MQGKDDIPLREVCPTILLRIWIRVALIGFNVRGPSTVIECKPIVKFSVFVVPCQLSLSAVVSDICPDLKKSPDRVFSVGNTAATFATTERMSSVPKYRLLIMLVNGSHHPV
jgi:hypothetical protein